MHRCQAGAHVDKHVRQNKRALEMKPNIKIQQRQTEENEKPETLILTFILLKKTIAERNCWG